MQQGLNLWLQGERPAPKPLNHKDLLIYWEHHTSIWMSLLPGMSIKSRYPVPKTTGIARISTSTDVGTLLLVVPVPNTEKTLNFVLLLPVLPKYRNLWKYLFPVKVPVTGMHTDEGFNQQICYKTWECGNQDEGMHCNMTRDFPVLISGIPYDQLFICIFLLVTSMSTGSPPWNWLPIHVKVLVKVPFVGIFTVIPIVGTFTKLGIGTNTGTETLRYRYRYRYRNTDKVHLSSPVPVPKYRFGQEL
jgi:hypothetical protein